MPAAIVPQNSSQIFEPDNITGHTPSGVFVDADGQRCTFQVDRPEGRRNRQVQGQAIFLSVPNGWTLRKR